jgi:hypothetical protein
MIVSSQPQRQGFLARGVKHVQPSRYRELSARRRGELPNGSALKSAFPVLGNPANRNRAIPLTYDQFRYAFANAVSEEEAKQLYETYRCRPPANHCSKRRRPT